MRAWEVLYQGGPRRIIVSDVDPSDEDTVSVVEIFPDDERYPPTKRVCITTKSYHFYDFPADMPDEEAMEAAEAKFGEGDEPDDYEEADTQVEVV